MFYYRTLLARYIARNLHRAPNGGRKGVPDPLPVPFPFDRAETAHVGAPPIEMVYWVIDPAPYEITLLPQIPALSEDPHVLKAQRNRSQHVWHRVDRLNGPAPTAKATLLLLHGWSDSVDKRTDLWTLGALLANAGYRCVLPDLRGHGYSTGDYITYGLLDRWDIIDLLNVLEERNELIGSEVGVIGHSYGGNVALMTAAYDRRIAAIVAASAPSTLRDVLPVSLRKFRPKLGYLVPGVALDKTIYRLSELSGVDHWMSDSREAIRNTKAPVLLLHGDHDKTVPYESSEHIYNARPENTTFLTLHGDGHATYWSDRLQDLGSTCAEFFDQNL